MAHLDYREKGGFTRSKTTFYPRDSQRDPFEILVYVAMEGNINYMGTIFYFQSLAWSSIYWACPSSF